MKTLVILIMTAAAYAAYAAPDADPALGFWVSADDKTGADKAGWQLYVENGLLYGKILSLAGFPQDVTAHSCKDSYKGFPLPGSVREMPVVGPPWIFGLKNDAPGRWSGGSVIDPETGAIYACVITVHAADGKRFALDTLELRGSVGPLGKSRFWKKSDAARAGGLR